MESQGAPTEARPGSRVLPKYEQAHNFASRRTRANLTADLDVGVELAPEGLVLMSQFLVLLMGQFLFELITP